VAYSTVFEEAVKRAIGNRSYRSVAREVGVTHSYIGDVYQGRIPSRDVVLKLAEVVGADADTLLMAAGYAPKTPFDADRRFMAGLRQIAGKAEGPVTVSTEEIPLASASPEEVARALAAIRQRMGQQGEESAEERTEQPVEEPDRKPRRGRPRGSRTRR
jgi:transcriptional regulator with XRE-family HTH domain